MKTMYGINPDLSISESNNYEITNSGSTSNPFWSYTFKENEMSYTQDEIFENIDDAEDKVNAQINGRIKTISNKMDELSKEILELLSKVQ